MQKPYHSLLKQITKIIIQHCILNYSAYLILLSSNRNKQTYANNASITAICQNRTVCKECKKIHTSLTPKILKNYQSVENLSYFTVQNVSTFYHILTFLKNARTSV